MEDPMRRLLRARALGRLLLPAAGALFLLVARSAIASAAGVVDQQQTSSGGAACFGGASFQAQTFTADVTGSLDAVDVHVVRFDDGTFQIQAVDGNNKPTGVALASGTVPAGISAWERVAFTSPVPVVAGTMYAIVSDACTTDTNWDQADGSDSYAGGAPYQSADGSTWTARSGFFTDDFAFKTYVQPATTTTITAVDHNPSVVGQPVTVSAAVSPATAGADSEAPLGAITIHRGADSCVITLPASQCTITPASAGTKNITASYVHTANGDGDGEFQDSVATPVSHHVNKAATSISVTTDPSPTVYRQPVTLRAKVQVVAPGSATPAGSVDFYFRSDLSGLDLVCSLTNIDTQGRASCPLQDGLNIGVDRVFAVYRGDAQTARSVSPVVIHHVLPASTSTVLSVSPDSVKRGDNVQLTATVSCVKPAERCYVRLGKVQFFIDGHRLSPQVAVDFGQATLTVEARLVRGSHHVRATFTGGSDTSSGNHRYFVASSSPGMLLYVQ
jgi:Bacterial Ig-like domain (group 3)